ncbi:MAG: hypothetical protein J6O04_09585 [Selenomonadaceae bacterium]|nr:hypothetical protein [Selenomonadaceae bacterium]
MANEERVLTAEETSETQELAGILRQLPRDGKLKAIGYGAALLTEQKIQGGTM